MNPFAALQVSDDEDTFVQNGNSNQPKPPKKSKCAFMQPTKRESRSRRPRSERLRAELRPSTRTSLRESRRTRGTRSTRRPCSPRRPPPLATTPTRRAAPVAPTDPERKEEAEATSETSRTNSTRTSTLPREPRSPRKQPSQLLKNPKESPLKSTTRTRVSKSTSWMLTSKP